MGGVLPELARIPRFEAIAAPAANQCRRIKLEAQPLPLGTMLLDGRRVRMDLDIPDEIHEAVSYRSLNYRPFPDKVSDVMNMAIPKTTTIVAPVGKSSQ